MNCFGCERNLSAYLDDELGTEERLEIESHLESCERCRAEFESHEAAWEATGGLQSGAAPDGMWREIETELEDEGRATTSLDDLALMIKGLASEVQDLRRSMEGLRRQVEQAEWSEEREPSQAHAGTPEIRVSTGSFRTTRSREASMEQLRRSS